MIIQYCDDVLKDSHGINPTDNRLYRAIQREIQESLLTTPNGTEGFEEYEDCDPELPPDISIIDEIEFFERYEGEF